MTEKEANKWIDKNLDDGVYYGEGRSITGEDRRKLVAQLREAYEVQREEYDYYYGEVSSLADYLKSVQQKEKRAQQEAYESEVAKQREIHQQLVREEEERKRRAIEKERQAQEAENKKKLAQCQRVKNVIELYKENLVELHHLISVLDDVFSVTDKEIGINIKELNILKTIATIVKNKNHIETPGEFFKEATDWLSTHQVKIVSIGFIESEIFHVFPTIKSIRLSIATITDKDTQQLAQIPVGQLTVFEAKDSQFESPRTKPNFLDILFKNNRLSQLTLNNCGITQNYIEKIEQYAEENSELTQVYIRSDLLSKKDGVAIGHLLNRNKLLAQWETVFKRIDDETDIQKRCDILRQLNWGLQPFKELAEHKAVDKKIMECIDRHRKLVEQLLPQRMEKVDLYDEKKFSVEFRQFQELVYALIPEGENQKKLFQEIANRVLTSEVSLGAIVDFMGKFARVKKLSWLPEPSAPSLAELIAQNGTSPVFGRISEGVVLPIPVNNPTLR